MFSAAAFGAAGSNRVPLVIAFAVLQVLGGIGMLSVLFTMLFSRQVHRQITWVNFCLSWIIYAFSYILLLLFNGEFGKEPNRALCATQAALIYGAPVVTAYTSLSLWIQLFLNTYAALCDTEDNRKGIPVPVFWLVVCPWILYGIVIFAAFEQSLSHLETVQRGLVFCYIDTMIPGKISAALVILALVATIHVEVTTAVILYRRWRVYRALKVSLAPSLEMLARIFLFTLFAIVAICTAALLVTLRVESAAAQTLLALMPLVAFLTVGVQKDIVGVWLWCVGTPVGSDPGTNVAEPTNCLA